ncbi:MAG: hypothetical protein IJ127_01520 [Afipia sp.]|jgi:hypothetical protein|uniref:hypothetical protein n=2 Tax=Pseudomonadota TaxID=1224 RepID=UPI000AF058C9|nr:MULTISPECIES: hypothetical protein [Sphingobium]MBQ8101581.1 hypothetical protein [Afipia sp.]|tara:strand:- start:303 stop:527 length:225 start_codon:yes stop_codon:yes gene_type:complete
MARVQMAAIPAAPRCTLLHWIENDHGNTSELSRPACSKQAQALHAKIILDAGTREDGPADPIPPPTGLSLPPLG